MRDYLDIKLLPDPEFSQSMLMNALYAKLHRALVNLKNTDMGISFPFYDEAKPCLGGRLRLHGSEEILNKLMQQPWLNGMRDHVRVGSVLPVPETSELIQVKRVQAKSNVERLRRRRMKRHQLTEAEVKEILPDGTEERLKLPFLTVKSYSTAQTFRFFIKQTRVSEGQIGQFNAYGFSLSATLPYF